MTGFARLTGEVVDAGKPCGQWSWEVRSVNARGLDQRYRLPPGFDRLEPKLRGLATRHLARGAFSASLSIRMDGADTFRVNESALESALEKIRDIAGRIDCAPPRAEAILALKGILDTDKQSDDPGDLQVMDQPVLDGFDAILALLVNARQQEGEGLRGILEKQLAEIERLTGEARARAGESVSLLRARIERQVADLLGAREFDGDRLAQEVALLAVKADIAEELDRLDTHIESAKGLLAGGGPVGRKLDFLTQELNREANTLCSKAPDSALKQIGLDLKSVIDQLREQVQNVE